MSGRRSERTYAVRSGSERWAFVPHPEIAGWWFRCHPCVLVVPCKYEGCGAMRGQPCKTVDGYHMYTHAVRRKDAVKGVAALDYAMTVVSNIERKGRGETV